VADQGADAAAAGVASADVAVAVRDALRHLHAVIQHHAARVDVGVVPGLRAAVPPSDLSRLLQEILATAIAAEPGQYMLLTAEKAGADITIVLTDDAASDPMVATAGRWDAVAVRAAAHGGRLDVIASPSGGTTVRLLLMGAERSEPRTGEHAGNGGACDTPSRHGAAQHIPISDQTAGDSVPAAAWPPQSSLTIAATRARPAQPVQAPPAPVL